MECQALCRVNATRVPLLSSTDGFGSRSPASVGYLASARSHILPSPALVCNSRGASLASLRHKSPFSNPPLGGHSSAQTRHSTQVNASKQTFSSFDDMLSKSDVPVLVDFYATWCGPCQYMVPILNEVGQALKDELRIVKIDSEKYPHVASRYGVQALPTLIIFREGQPIDRLEGALPADKLISRVKQVLYGSRAKARN